MEQIDDIIKSVFFDERNEKMTKKRVFISFDVDHDEGTKKMLAGQAKLPDSPFDFKDASVCNASVGIGHFLKLI